MYKRKLEKPDENFIDNIINKSYGIMQKKPLFALLQNVFKEFYLPSPQYALSVVLVAGIAMGILMADTQTIDYFDDFYLVEEFNYE